MRSLFKLTRVSLMIAGFAVLGTVSGCGGGGANNDAGSGFTLVGFNPVENNRCSRDVYTSIVLLPISNGITPEQGVGDLGVVNICLTLQNNMLTQAVRADRAIIRYYIGGSDVQPPSTVTSATAYLPSATGNTSLPNGGVLPTGGTQPGVQPGTKPQSTLPSGSVGRPSTGVTTGTGGGNTSGAVPSMVAFSIVPASIREWISNHRNDLPPAPFEMIASVQVSGVTSAGDRIETNELGFTIIVSEDNLF